MSIFHKRFVAVLLAIWLPLFSGNALAASLAMQFMGGDCHAAQRVSQPMHHMHSASNHAQSAALSGPQNCDQTQQHFSHNNCGACQVACCGYMAAAAFKLTEAQPSAQLFTLFSKQFQSVTFAPLVPPPLARV